jgi:hypothetical protein
VVSSGSLPVQQMNEKSLLPAVTIEQGMVDDASAGCVVGDLGWTTFYPCPRPPTGLTTARIPQTVTDAPDGD